MIIKEIEILKQKCIECSLEEGKEIIKLLEYELLMSNDGIGLAANQIGINKKVCIIRTNKAKIDLINPSYEPDGYSIIFEHEGCLSFPGQLIKTLRYEKIKVCDFLHTEPLFLSGLEAIIAQHEIDHLNGITMFDRKI